MGMKNIFIFRYADSKKKKIIIIIIINIFIFYNCFTFIYVNLMGKIQLNIFRGVHCFKMILFFNS